MNDETRQMQEKLFDRIVLGLTLIGLISALSTLLITGYSSPWFFRSLALMIVALVAFGLRRVTQFVVAAYVLIIQLLGITTAILLQTATAALSPFLFIPVVIIAGLVLSPTATIIVAVISVLIILVVSVLNYPFSIEILVRLLPPSTLIAIAALLVIEGRRYVERLNDRLVESRTLLRERTLEMMEARDTIDELQNKAKDLKQQLLTRQDEKQEIEKIARQKNEDLYKLIKGSIQELDTSVEELERLVDAIGEESSAADQANSLEQIWEKIYHLNNLVINLEDIAQLKNERIVLNYQDIDIAQLIRDVVGTTRGLARGKNLEIRCQVPEDIPKIPLDPIRIRQALLYILNNAIKYTDQGIIEVQAEMNSKELLIFVSDTGIGMHREEMDLVFKEFGRGSGTMAQQRQGTGLGLAISKSLIELHGGHMWVTSVLGVGSTFYINLPLERHVPAEVPAEVPVSITQPDLETTVASIPRPTIPVIDTEETMASSRPANGKSQSANKSGFGSPVGRFSPTYIGRLVFIALAVLLVIASGVAILASFHGPVNQEEIAATASVSPTSIAVAVNPENTPTEETTAPTSTNTPVSQATATPEPTDTPTTLPTDTPPAINEATPTETPTTVSEATGVSKATATEIPPSPTSEKTPTEIPQPTATHTVQPAAVVSGADVQQVSTRRPARGLAVTANGLLGLHTINNGSNSNADVLGAIVPESNVSWSPDGNRVLFTSARDGNYEIYMANKDGSEIINLTNAGSYDTHPSWSPNGRSIAFSSQRGGNVDIYVMNTDGSNVQPLTTDRGYEEWPVWSPDGRKIAFISDRDGNNEIYIMNADGSNQQRITYDPADDWPATWSPDGRKLVFSSNRDGNWNLYVIDVSGGDAQQLTNATTDERDPAWSPDGGKIAFVTNAGGNWDVFTLPAPTGSVTVVAAGQWTQFTDTPGIDERYPTWAP